MVTWFRFLITRNEYIYQEVVLYKWLLSFVILISLTGCYQTIHEPIWESCSHANCSSNDIDIQHAPFNLQHLS